MITQSSLGLYRACPRRYQWRYIKGWRDQTPSDALEIGTLVHRGLDLFWTSTSWSDARRTLVQESPKFFHSEEGKIYLAQVLAYVEGYYTQYNLDDWETLGVEEDFKIEIGGVEFAGKMDARARRKSDGKQFLIEHKTAKFADDSYFARLASAMNTQLVLYREAVRIMSGEDCGLLYDVILKSNSAPTYRADETTGKIPRPRRRKDESEEDFDVRKMSLMETLDEYRVRLTQDYIGNPDKYIRKIITCTEQEHEEALKDILFVAAQIHQSKEHERYPRNSNNCWSYGRNCEYFNICVGVDTPETSGHLELVENLHPELNQEIKNDKPF